MGVDPWHDWNAHYEVLPGKEKVVSELKQLAEKADHIYLATDLDREGEAIARHLREVIGGDEQRYSRVVFNEITKNAIRQAFEKPGELNIDRVNAQQARRFMDRVVGYMVSPLLWKKIARGLSAGRVQSVAVRPVVEREREIKAFVPEEYWEVDASTTTPGGDALPLQVTHKDDKPFRPVSRDETMAAVSMLEKASYSVLEREDKPTSSKPGAPFITSTLQQAASTRLGFGVKKTMMMAQRLYEAGHITYMRTDSTNLSQDALNMVRGYISDKFGKKYLPDSANQYASKENSQEAHEAIRPSDVNVLAETLKDMEADAQKLYQLIWRQFVACQMTPAQYDSTTLTVAAGDFKLKARGRTLRFDGWTKVMPALRKGDEDRTLPLVKQGDRLSLGGADACAALYQAAGAFQRGLAGERAGKTRDWPSVDLRVDHFDHSGSRLRAGGKSSFYAEKMGEIVTDRLEENFRDLMNYDFTAQMEDRLDRLRTTGPSGKRC
ncbi:type I DNA topoisomerase [Klebsiella pneumoniae]|uniref:DNA topoisomerase n=1 Tax=Klebsiella pneumoniae TaxID=573 RepID=A0A5C2LJ57_KLEPN|nr:type I DNA topoisomerase [Klebsiella pneumoniae]